ncbi:MAG: hypothetical protein U0271_10050 [Polyangiaceae bacterium]
MIERCVARSAARRLLALSIRTVARSRCASTCLSTAGKSSCAARRPRSRRRRTPRSSACSTQVAPHGDAYVIVEPVEGPVLTEVLPEGFSRTETVVVIRRVLDALAHLEKLGLSHGSVTPAHVALARGRIVEATLVDVVLVAPSLIASESSFPSLELGAASYLSPERVRGEGPSPAADVFAAGALLYTMLAGRSPFAAENVFASQLRVLYEAPPPVASVDPGRRHLPALETLAVRLLTKDPVARPTADSALAAIEAIDDGLTPDLAREDASALLAPFVRSDPGGGVVLCRSPEPIGRTLDTEGVLEGVELLVRELGGRVDHVDDSTVTVHVASSSTATAAVNAAVIRAARAALILQTAMPAASLVVARGGVAHQGSLEAAARALDETARGRIAVLPDLANTLEPHFELAAEGHTLALFEKDAQTHDRSHRVSASPSSVTLPNLREARYDFDNETTVVENVRRTVEIDLAPMAIALTPLEPLPTLEMDMTGLAQASMSDDMPRPREPARSQTSLIADESTITDVRVPTASDPE